jgi:Mn-dependent DtxR family transcriptional regulator
MARQLKDNQMHTLRFIYDYIKSNNCAPATKEIAKALGISMSTAYERIHHLCGQSYLTRPVTGKYGRYLVLTSKGILACESLSEE